MTLLFRLISLYLLTGLLLTPIATLVMAAEQPPAAQEAVASPPGEKLIDLSKPEEALNPDRYLALYQLGKSWIISHGPNLVVAVLMLLLGRLLARWFSTLARKAMTRGKVDSTLASFLGKVLYYALLAAVLIAAADQAGIRTTSFVAIFGAAGLAVGLALKDSLANFASGVMLILFRPFKAGDAVTAGGITGTVQQIDIFSTIILTADNQRIIVPNSTITSNVITNVNAEELRRIDLLIGIGYQDDLRLAKETLQELIDAEPRILAKPVALVAVAELAESSVNLVVRPWVRAEDYWSVRFALTERIKLSFDEKGISFPFPQRELHIHQLP